LSQSTTAWSFSIINKTSRIIQVDIDAAEVGRNFPVEVGITGEAKTVAAQLLEALRAKSKGADANSEWRSEIAALKEKRKTRLRAEEGLAGDPMPPQRVYPELKKVLPRDCMVTIDAGVCPGMGYDRLDFEFPKTLFNYGGHGGLGMGLCVGLGTKLGLPDRPAVSLQGDGGFLYTAQELNTAVRFKIPHVAIVMNNSCHGSEKAQQMRYWEKRYVAVDLDNPRFDKLAEAFGARGFYVERPQDIAGAVKEALAIDGPAVVEIPVAQEFPAPAAAPGGSSRAY
jgi:acetolactate synthase I/II/III large subunit